MPKLVGIIIRFKRL